MNFSLDWSFYNWDLISNFVLKGLGFQPDADRDCHRGRGVSLARCWR